MLNKKQSDVAAEVLLASGREAQEAAQLRKDEQLRKVAVQRRSAMFGLAGLVIGGAIGYMISGRVVPAGLLGMGIGVMLGYLIKRRAA